MMYGKDSNLNLMGLRLATLFGLIALALPTEPQFWVACGTAITVVGSLIMQAMNNRQNDKRYERDRQAMLDQHAEIKTGMKANTASIRKDVAENTALTSLVGEKADAAYEVANGVNEKIASLASGPIPAVTDLSIDTNEVVHRIETKI